MNPKCEEKCTALQGYTWNLASGINLPGATHKKITSETMRILHSPNQSKYKVTIVGCVHGTETFGYRVYQHFARQINKFAGLTIILANEPAHRARKRFCESDLNRSFPGDQFGNIEQRIAYELIKLIDPTSYIVDIHTAQSTDGLVPIVVNLTKRSKAIIAHTQAKRLVYIPQGFGSMISQYQAAVSLEYNTEYAKDPQRLAELEKIIRGLTIGRKPKSTRLLSYRCLGKLPLDTTVDRNARSFVPLSGSGLIPLFPRRRAYNGSKGFLLSKPKILKL